MDFGIKHCRSKSSDTFTELIPNPLSPQSTSICQHSPRARKKSVEEVQTSEQHQESPRSKSHEFLRKIFASSEKKNVACKADNEFITRYYSRTSRSEEDFSRCLDENEFPPSKYRTYIKRSLQSDFEDIKSPEANLAFAETFYSDEVFPVNNHENCDFIDKLSSQRHDVFFLDNEANEPPGNARRQSSTCATLDRHGRKKVNRKKSFKQLLSSVVKWKKTGSKRSAKRFLSYDDLLEEKAVPGDADRLSRTVSLQTVVLQAQNENSTDEKQVGAAVHSSCGSSKDELQKWVVEETKRLFLRDESNLSSNEERDEVLVKPSAIRDCAKRYSQIHEVQQNAKHSNIVARCKSIRPEQLYSREKLLENIQTGPPKQYITICATRM